MKSLLFTLTICLIIGINFKAQTATTAQYMRITTIESTVSGGSGRPKLIITHEDGKQEETDMMNLFSLLGNQL